MEAPLSVVEQVRSAVAAHEVRLQASGCAPPPPPTSRRLSVVEQVRAAVAAHEVRLQAGPAAHATCAPPPPPPRSRRSTAEIRADAVSPAHVAVEMGELCRNLCRHSCKSRGSDKSCLAALSNMHNDLVAVCIDERRRLFDRYKGEAELRANLWERIRTLDGSGGKVSLSTTMTLLRHKVCLESYCKFLGFRDSAIRYAVGDVHPLDLRTVPQYRPAPKTCAITAWFTQHLDENLLTVKDPAIGLRIISQRSYTAWCVPPPHLPCSLLFATADT